MYDRIARFYDLVHADLVDDVKFLLTLADRVGGPVLELGCGTGRVLLPLARAGHHVTGVDSSGDMLDRAREKLHGEGEMVQSNVDFVEGDMTSVRLEGKFQLVIVSYNTLMHFEKSAMTVLLRRVRDHLHVGGTLYVDVDNPFEISDSDDDDLLILERTMTDPNTGDIVVQASSSWVDSDAQYRHITWLFDVSPPSGGTIERTIVEADYHYLFPHELETTLTGARFHLEELLGGYDREPFNEKSARLIALAKA